MNHNQQEYSRRPLQDPEKMSCASEKNAINFAQQISRIENQERALHLRNNDCVDMNWHNEHNGQKSIVIRRPRTWKKPKDMPKRPLSAYNLFFRKERERLNASHSVEGEDDFLAPGLGFANLAKMIGAKWKFLAKSDREPFEKEATEEKSRYRAAVARWRQEQKLPPSTTFATPEMPNGRIAGSWTTKDGIEAKFYPSPRLRQRSTGQISDNFARRTSDRSNPFSCHNRGLESQVQTTQSQAKRTFSLPTRTPEWKEIASHEEDSLQPAGAVRDYLQPIEVRTIGSNLNVNHDEAVENASFDSLLRKLDAESIDIVTSMKYLPS